MEWKASADEMLQYIEDNEDDPSIKSLRTKLNEMNISGSSSSKDPDISTDRSENGGRDSRDEMLKKGLFMLKQMADKQIGTKPTKSTTIWKPPEIRFPNLMEHTQDPGMDRVSGALHYTPNGVILCAMSFCCQRIMVCSTS